MEANDFLVGGVMLDIIAVFCGFVRSVTPTIIDRLTDEVNRLRKAIDII